MTTTTRASNPPTHPAAVRESYDHMVRATAGESRFLTRPSGRKVRTCPGVCGPVHR